MLLLFYAVGVRVLEPVALCWRELQSRDEAGQITMYGNEGRLGVIDEVIAPDARHHGPRAATVVGTAPIKDLITEVRQAFPVLHVAIENLIAEGDRVVARNTVSGTHQGAFMGLAPTGKRFVVTHIHIFQYADGQVVEHWAVHDDLGMLQQLGALPRPAAAGAPT